MPHPITRTSKFTYDLLNRELNIPASDKTFFETMLQAYNGDFWQKGAGSLLPPASGSQSSFLDGLLHRRFVFRNVIRECVERVSKAFLGKSPDWRLQSGGQDVEEIDERLSQALSEFWTKQNVASVMSDAFESRLTTGRGGIRMYIPVKFKRRARVAAQQQADDETPVEELQNNDDAVSFKDFFEALDAIRVEFISPTDSVLLDDEAEFFSIVRYSIRDNWENDQRTNVIEFSFVDDDDMTFIGIVPERGTSQADQSSTNTIEGYIKSDGFDLDGMPTYFEMKGKPYVTEALYKNNQLLNLALTCAGFSLVDAGFGEVFLTNVELETETVTDASGEQVEVPKSMKRGGSAVQNLVGIRNYNEETGQESYTTPGVHFKEPTSLETFSRGKDIAYSACLEEAGQLYAKISGDATASGESRIQAMKDFYLKIVRFKPEIDQLGGWVMTTALRWAAALSSAKELFDTSIVFDSKIYIGEVSGSDRQIVLTMFKDGLISLETARVLTGIDDPDLESIMVESENVTQLDLLPISEKQRRVELANQMIGLLPDRMIRQVAFGYTDEELNKIDAEFARQAEQQTALLGEEEPERAEDQDGFETDDETNE